VGTSKLNCRTEGAREINRIEILRALDRWCPVTIALDLVNGPVSG